MPTHLAGSYQKGGGFAAGAESAAGRDSGDRQSPRSSSSWGGLGGDPGPAAPAATGSLSDRPAVAARISVWVAEGPGCGPGTHGPAGAGWIGSGSAAVGGHVSTPVRAGTDPRLYPTGRPRANSFPPSVHSLQPRTFVNLYGKPGQVASQAMRNSRLLSAPLIFFRPVLSFAVAHLTHPL